MPQTLPPDNIQATEEQALYERYPQLSRNPLHRILWLILAYVSFAFGVIAIFIPGIPTTEFVMLAAYAASKSSPKFHHWLENNKLFGPMIRNWREHRSVTRRVKISASCTMSLCIIILAFTVPHRWVTLLAAIGMSIGAYWLWSRPEKATTCKVKESISS